MSDKMGQTEGVGHIYYGGSRDELNARLRARDNRITELEAALKPFADAVYYDNGDVTIVYPCLSDYMRGRRVLRVSETLK